MKGLSETITVRSIVDRFLEHSRIYYFENACQPEVFLASADWLPRNCFRRIELAFPIEDGVLRDRLISEILAVTMADNTKARLLQPDGSYRRARRAPDEPVRRSQFDFIALATGTAPARQAKTAKTRYPKVKLAASPFAPPSRPK